MKTIQLTPEDVASLCMALGYANGASTKKAGAVSFGKLTDRILVQLGVDNYTYWKPRSEVVADLQADGITVPTAS
jgi:hypothetical protein